MARMLIVASGAMFGAGCGGIGASGSVSPATFLLPGLGQADPQNTAAPESVFIKKSPEVAAYSSDLVR
jgi:hypothetical protein